jgi:phenylalanyl-tRNA synthetase beta chain
MKLSREWLSDYIDLSDLGDEELGARMTEVGHAIEAMERHGDDTVLDAEITTNRVDAMSHLGMARELAAALGREVKPHVAPVPGARKSGDVTVRIEAPELCSRYTAVVVRGVTVGPSPPYVQRRLEAVGLRPINNVVDVTNYVMMALGHPLHAFDLSKVAGKTIVVRAGREGETMKTLDGEMRKLDPTTIVIADGRKAVGLGGIMGGAESEIGDSTADVLLECAFFNPSAVRRTARRLGMKTDASYRFERRVDPGDTVDAAQFAAALIAEFAGGIAEAPIDVVAAEVLPKTLVLRTAKLHEASAGAVGDGYAMEIFRRLGFGVTTVAGGLSITVPTFRGDIHEEADLIEEVLRFFGLNNVPASLPRLTTGDVRPNTMGIAEDEIRRILVGSGLAEAINYSFIRAEHNPLFSDEPPVAITNALSENINAMRLSLLPGLLETVVFNRSYGNRDGAMFEVGRTYHRAADGKVDERHRVGVVLFGTIGTHWGDAKRAIDFFDIKGIVEQVAQKFHVALDFAPGDPSWLRKGKRAVARHGDRHIATLGFLASDVLQKFGIKGDVAAAEIDVSALLASTGSWKMAGVSRFPGVPMILAFTHGRDLDYQRILETVRSFDVPDLHEVGLRDRFVPEGEEAIKTTLGMWYQASDRSLTQEEVGQRHQQLASRLAELLPVKLLS